MTRRWATGVWTFRLCSLAPFCLPSLKMQYEQLPHALSPSSTAVIDFSPAYALSPNQTLLYEAACGHCKRKAPDAACLHSQGMLQSSSACPLLPATFASLTHQLCEHRQQLSFTELQFDHMDNLILLIGARKEWMECPMEKS